LIAIPDAVGRVAAPPPAASALHDERLLETAIERIELEHRRPVDGGSSINA
jgi:hypothetical protein